jgi:hypothetical protein
MLFGITPTETNANSAPRVTPALAFGRGRDFSPNKSNRATSLPVAPQTVPLLAIAFAV